MKLVSYLIMFILIISTVSAGKVVYTIYAGGISMLPMLPNGGLIQVTTTSPDELIVGDVYCFRGYTPNTMTYANGHICHQLVKIQEGMAYFKGLNGIYICDYYEKDWCGDKPVPVNRVALHVIGGFINQT